jgi:hypothetical protein
MKGLNKFKGRDYFVIEDQNKKSHLKRWDIIDTGGTNVSRIVSNRTKRNCNNSRLSHLPRRPGVTKQHKNNLL